MGTIVPGAYKLQYIKFTAMHCNAMKSAIYIFTSSFVKSCHSSVCRKPSITYTTVIITT